MPISNQCPNCVFYLGALECAAFPDGIPFEILSGEVDHRKPYEGDHGYQWEKFTEAKKEKFLADYFAELESA